MRSDGISTRMFHDDLKNLRHLRNWERYRMGFIIPKTTTPNPHSGGDPYVFFWYFWQRNGGVSWPETFSAKYLSFSLPLFQKVQKKWCYFIRFFFKEWLRQTLQTYSSSFSRFRLMITKIWLTGFASWFPDQFRKVLRFIWNLLIGKTCYQHFKFIPPCHSKKFSQILVPQDDISD